jgi:pyruvate/2-oxoglutarate dehydrogenase complex dihydrolipoamide dehydrogenase (E3) component
LQADFDVLVIGGGGTGYAAAYAAAKLGKHVAMVERAKLGGTCLNVGCVPTKALLRSAQVAETVRRAGDFGVQVEGWRPDYPQMVARARSLIADFAEDDPHESLARKGIALLEGSVSFVSPHETICGGHRSTAQAFVIATGSTSVVPPIPGLQDVPYLTSDAALWLDHLPPSVVIVGGGIVSCEFASLWAALGTEVTIVSRRLLSNEDSDVGDALLTAFEARGIRVVRGRAVRFERARNGIAVSVEGDGEDARRHRVTADSVLIATGRRPRYDDLHLEQAGVTAGDHGIEVDETMRTSTPHIWAAGDVVGCNMYTHAGDLGGTIAGWNAAGGAPERTADWRVVPRPIYAIPEVAAVGMTERDARDRGLDVEVGTVCYADVTRTALSGEAEGFVKIIAERSTGQILGAAIVGAQACELISEVAVAMAGHLTVRQVGDTLHPYPTLSEIVRWAADQAGQAIRKERRPDAGQHASVEHTHPLGTWPTEGSRERSAQHVPHSS